MFIANADKGTRSLTDHERRVGCSKPRLALPSERMRRAGAGTGGNRFNILAILKILSNLKPIDAFLAGAANPIS